MAEKLKPLAIGYSTAVIAASAMLLLSLAGALGMYTGAVEMMSKAHMFYSLSVVGTITGMIEAAVLAFIAGYLFSWVYNKFS